MNVILSCQRLWTNATKFVWVWVLILTASLSGCGGGQMGQSPSPAAKTLRSVSITPQTPSIALGNTLQFGAMAFFSDGSKSDVTDAATWTSAQPSVASINAVGLAVSRATGATSISVVYKSASAACTLTIAPPVLVSIAVSPQNASLTPNHSVQLRAAGTFGDGTTQDVSSVVHWSSAPAGVVTISATGLSTANAPGAATVTASEGSINGSDTLTVALPSLLSIAVMPQNPSLALNHSVQLTATGTFSDGATQDLSSLVTWSSTPPGIVSTSNTGVATGRSPGGAIVTASDGSIVGSDTLTVAPPTLLSIAVTPRNPSLTPNHSVQLSATGTFSDGTSKDLSSLVMWSSTPPSIVSTSSTGVAIAKTPGSAIVTASDGSIAGSDTLTVTPPILTSIAVSPQNLTLTPGHFAQLTSMGTYSDGTTQDISSSVRWSLSPAGIVVVTNSGVAIAQGPGVATIIASSNTVSATDVVDVVAPTLTSISITPGGVSVPPGGNQQLAATGMYSDGSVRDLSSSVQWTSSSAAILIVNSLGMATANAVGSVTVTAISNSISGNTQLQVSDIVSLAIVPSNPVLALGGSEQLTAQAQFFDGSIQDVTSSVSWSSSAATIVSVNSKGLLLAAKIGSATISASLAGVAGSAVATVKPVLAVAYFSNANMSGVADATLRLTNPGITGSNLCAEIYVFDQDQQLSECCGCLVSPNGLRTLSVNTDLTGNPLTGSKSRNGVVKIVSADASTNPSCTPTTIAPKASLVAWSTGIQAQSASSFAITETPFQPGPLGDAELGALQSQCSFAATLGSGQGVCSCGTAADTPQ